MTRSMDFKLPISMVLCQYCVKIRARLFNWAKRFSVRERLELYVVQLRQNPSDGGLLLNVVKGLAIWFGATVFQTSVRLS